MYKIENIPVSVLKALEWQYHNALGSARINPDLREHGDEFGIVFDCEDDELGAHIATTREQIHDAVVQAAQQVVDNNNTTMVFLGTPDGWQVQIGYISAALIEGF